MAGMYPLVTAVPFLLRRSILTDRYTLKVHLSHTVGQQGAKLELGWFGTLGVVP